MIQYRAVTSFQMFVPIHEHQQCIIPFYVYDWSGYDITCTENFDEDRKTAKYWSPCVDLLNICKHFDTAPKSKTEFLMSLLSLFIREKLAIMGQLECSPFSAVLVDDVTFLVNIRDNWLGIYHKSPAPPPNNTVINRVLFLVQFDTKDVAICNPIDTAITVDRANTAAATSTTCRFACQ